MRQDQAEVTRYEPTPPEPGDVRRYGCHEAICDEATLRYRVYALTAGGDTLVCETRSWAVVLCKVFGVLPTTVGGKAEVQAYSAHQYATLKVWTDPDTAEERTVVGGTIMGHWTVVLILEDGERVMLGEEGRVIDRFYMAPVPGPKTPAPQEVPEPTRTVRVMKPGFESAPLPADPVRKGVFEDDQGLLF